MSFFDKLKTNFATTRHHWRVMFTPPLPLFLGLFLLSLMVSIPTLWLSSKSYPSLMDVALFGTYLTNPMILLLNILPPFILLLAFTFLWNRPWVGYLCMIPSALALPVANYFKISFRGDPAVIADLALLNDAARVAGNYTITIPTAMWILFFCAGLGLALTALVFPSSIHFGWKKRIISIVSVILASVLLYFAGYSSQICYNLTSNLSLVDRWSTSEVYLSRGVWYSFLNSATEQSILQASYTGSIEDLLSSYDYDGYAANIETNPINVVSIMLEGFQDFTNFEEFADFEQLQQHYSVWHELEEEGIYGELVTNIFGGGTVNTEWGFLTGYPDHNTFETPTNSYVWDFSEAGYVTVGNHPGYSDFYDRINVNQYLGFQSYRFSENYFADFATILECYYDSDGYVVDSILQELEDNTAAGDYVFSFSVTLQNHGPYDESEPTEKYTPSDSTLSYSSRAILETYFDQLTTTFTAITTLRDALEAMDEPVVMVLFGDHLPWMGNGYEGYLEAGVSFEQETEEGFFNYYSTPYIIWSNSAAKEVIGDVETGYGGDFSPCFLMNRLFQYCNWAQPAAMYISSEMMEVSPIVHQTGRYYFQGELVESLPEPYDMQLAQYYALHTYRREAIYVSD